MEVASRPVVGGLLEYTRQCVRGLLRHSRPPFDLVFLNPGALDGTSDYLAGLADGSPARIDVVAVEPEWGMAKEKKEEMIAVRGDYVAILNNDVIVGPHWLASMTGLLAAQPQLGMVGPMTNIGPERQLIPPLSYPTLQPAADPLAGPDWPPFLQGLDACARRMREERQGQWTEADSLGAGCAVLRKTCLQRLAAFPARSPLGHFDIPGLSQRVRQAGFGLAVCSDTFTHYFAVRGKV